VSPAFALSAGIGSSDPNEDEAVLIMDGWMLNELFPSKTISVAVGVKWKEAKRRPLRR